MSFADIGLAHAPEIAISKQHWMSFSEIGLSHARKIKISEKHWMSFPEIGLSHGPENLNLGKISGRVFEDLLIRVQ